MDSKNLFYLFFFFFLTLSTHPVKNPDVVPTSTPKHMDALGWIHQRLTPSQLDYWSKLSYLGIETIYEYIGSPLAYIRLLALRKNSLLPQIVPSLNYCYGINTLYQAKASCFGIEGSAVGQVLYYLCGIRIFSYLGGVTIKKHICLYSLWVSPHFIMMDVMVKWCKVQLYCLHLLSTDSMFGKVLKVVCVSSPRWPQCDWK